MQIVVIKPMFVAIIKTSQPRDMNATQHTAANELKSDLHLFFEIIATANIIAIFMMIDGTINMR